MDQQPIYSPQPQFSPVNIRPPQTAQLTPPNPPRNRWKWPLIISLVLFVTIGTIYAWFFLFPKAQSCLTRSDYQAITGESLADDAPFAPTIDFYGFDIEFANNTTTYSDPNTEPKLLAIAQFAKQHPGISLNINIQGMYTDDTKELTMERTTNTINQLVRLGMNKQTLTSELKNYSAGESQDETFSESSNIISVTVNSSETCK